MPAVQLLVPLAPRQLHVGGVDHHHHVAVVLVGAVRGFVLALQRTVRRSWPAARVRQWLHLHACMKSTASARSIQCGRVGGRWEEERAAAHLQDDGNLRSQASHHLALGVHKPEPQPLHRLHALQRQRKRLLYPGFLRIVVGIRPVKAIAQAGEGYGEHEPGNSGSGGSGWL